MRDALIVTALSVLPRNAMARWMGVAAVARWSRRLTRVFVRSQGVDLSEAVVPPGGFPTLDAMFTRTLRPGVRPIDSAPGVMVSPVDGVCAFAGTVDDDRLPIAPGRSVSISVLRGEPSDGPVDVVVLYLSPRDYHRVHVPREGRLVRWRYRPGTLWPVFPAAVRRIDGLFAQNERLSCLLETDHGPLDVILVGAFGVGRITVEGVPVQTNARGPLAEGALDREVSRGGELGTFHLGSTVVLVAPSGRWRLDVAEGAPVRMGAGIAQAAPDG